MPVVLLLVALGAAPAPRSAVVFSGPAMGGRYTVRVVMPPGDEPANDRIRTAISRELALVDRLLSTANTGSEISRLSAHASTEPFAVSPDALAVLELGRRASELSGGAFDVTAAPLVAAWGLGPSPAPEAAPTAAALAALRARVGYRMLQLDKAHSRVTKARPDVACDLGGLAGGWAVDHIAGALATLGYRDVLVEVGGEVAARGRRVDGGRWRVAVEWPDHARERALVLELEDTAVATSGDDRSRWTDAQGVRRSHILDPRTGAPVSHDLASATVVAHDGAWAEALATALVVLGPDAGRALAVREQLAVRLVQRQPDGSFAEWSTPAFEAVVARPR